MFTDVLCIFAPDCGGLDGVADRISRWTVLGSASSLPPNTRPRLLVVTSIPGHIFDSEALRFRQKLLSYPGYSNSFSSLNVINISRSSRPSPSLLSAFKEVMYAEIKSARRERTTVNTLFSMTHVAAFFHMALRSFAESPLSTFNFIKSSREVHPVTPNFRIHLEAFLSLCWKQNIQGDMLWELIASAFILDGFPPDIHCEYESGIYGPILY